MGHEQEPGAAAGHLLLFPFLAQGHLIPFLNLAKRLETQAHRRRLEVTILSTPRNVASLRRAVPAGSRIGFAELPFSPSDHGLPPDTESTEVVPLDAFPTFFFATEKLRPAFEALVTELVARAGRRNVCVLADIFLGWTAESAKALGVQHRVFLTSGAYASAASFSIWLHPPTFAGAGDDEQPLHDFPDEDVRVRYEDFLNVVVTEDPATDPMMAFLCRMVTLNFTHSGGLVVNTSEEIEPKGLRLIGKLSGLPTFAVGPLIGVVAAAPPEDQAAARNEDEDGCIKFLDSKPAASVLYVSFGSQNTIPASQMMELARGLEASGRPFIWVVRPPVEFDGAEEFRAAEWLPVGFEERVAAAGQGVVARRWAPQVAILGHPSTGAFLSHCGWNSVLETLWHGVPVLGWPLVADQVLDSKLLEELGVGVEVASGRMFGGLAGKGWEHVRDAVEAVLGDGEKARRMRRKAAELKEMARAAVSGGEDGEVKGSSVLAMERLLDTAFG
ncbi:hypothetical protein HU200_023247 [Digitaria exilis]|uniref:Glycosyltransferase n=1 Tax=Digitaria exilis TaxID=1010633 RepID=A0A835C1Y3_9POAL|nr:hypothetical protein HU200_023247 [Digitaria exilis]